MVPDRGAMHPERPLAFTVRRGIMPGSFFDWRAQSNRRAAPGFWSLTPGAGFYWTAECAQRFGGVPDSTLGWIAPLPVEDEGWPR